MQASTQNGTNVKPKNTIILGKKKKKPEEGIFVTRGQTKISQDTKSTDNIKNNNDQLDFIKMKNFCFSEDIVKKMQR